MTTHINWRAEPAKPLAGEPRDPALTPIERGLLRALATGPSNREIAHSLGKSENTVRNQLHALFGKLGARNRTEAALQGAGLSGGVAKA